MSLKDVVAVNIRNLRIKSNLTQEQLSEKAGLNPGYISRLESHPQNVTLDVVEKLAKVLECSVEEIIGGSFAGKSAEANFLLEEAMDLIRRFLDLAK